MKKFLYSLVLLAGLPLVAHAQQPLVAEAPMKSPGTPACVSISTSAWTAVPAVASVTTGRVGIFVTEVSTNSANMNAIFSATESPTHAITNAPIILKPGVSVYLGVNDKNYLYLRSLHTAAEDVCYQEVKQ